MGFLKQLTSSKLFNNALRKNRKLEVSKLLNKNPRMRKV